MSSKHTPGPWALESVQTSVGSCHKIGPFPSAGVRNQVHACVYADQLRLGLDDESPIAVELLANARLIAAAPELLAALVKAERLFREIGFIAAADSARPESLWNEINNAIAKATGGMQ